MLATVGGDDQITVVPHLNPEVVRADPKPFLGYSDNTNLLNWLWTHGVAGFHGGSTQVHLGPGAAIDEVHVRSLRAALLTGERLEVTELGELEDFGKDWRDHRQHYAEDVGGLLLNRHIPVGSVAALNRVPSVTHIAAGMRPDNRSPCGTSAAAWVAHGTPAFKSRIWGRHGHQVTSAGG